MKRPANPAGMQWATLVLLEGATKPRRISQDEQERQRKDPDGYRREQAEAAKRLWKEAEATARKRGWM